MPRMDFLLYVTQRGGQFQLSQSLFCLQDRRNFVQQGITMTSVVTKFSISISHFNLYLHRLSHHFAWIYTQVLMYCSKDDPNCNACGYIEDPVVHSFVYTINYADSDDPSAVCPVCHSVGS